MIRVDHLNFDDFSDTVKRNPATAVAYDKTSDAYLNWLEDQKVVENHFKRIKENGEYDIYEKDV